MEIAYGDIYGVPILELTPDSAWAKVALNPRLKGDTLSAWLRIAGLQNETTGWMLWTQFFAQDEAIQFLRDSMIAFYSRPQETARVYPKIPGTNAHSDYCMRVIRTVGNWMQVYLMVPSNWWTDPNVRKALYNSKNPPPKFWVRYLNKQGSPRIWFVWD
jgi:hypothetical protein